MADVSGRKIAVLATDGVEQVELLKPVEALRQAGADVVVISPSGDAIQGFNHLDKGDHIHADAGLAQVRPEQFDALLLPGGVANPDALRTMPQAVAFVRHFTGAGKPVAAICHGPWTLIEAGAVAGKRMTSWPSLKTDLANAGATWVDETVVRDGNLVTSRKPDDIPAFNEQMIALFGSATRQRAA